MLHAKITRLAVLLLLTVCGMTATATERELKDTVRFVPDTLARFELVLGRLQLSSEHFRIGAAHERLKLDDGRERTRSVAISTHRGRPTLQYRDSGGDEHVQLSFKADRMVDIEQAVGSNADRYKLNYHQPKEGPILLRIEFADGRSALDFKSDSLWHLAMQQPLAFDAYMQPCLSRLEPSWQITRSVSAVRDLMNNSLHPHDDKEVDRLVVQLDADQSSQRESALLQLESMGVAADYRLRRSLSADLSSQQETSIKRLLSTMQPSGSDTPMRVAVWLSGESK